MSLLSPTGTSRMWDADANGYARGDGIAAVILKKLSDAIADGDHIECVIRGTGVNQDGKSDGLTVPNSEAQALLIKNTYARAGLDLKDPLNWPQFFVSWRRFFAAYARDRSLTVEWSCRRHTVQALRLEILARLLQLHHVSAIGQQTLTLCTSVLSRPSSAIPVSTST